MPRGGHEDKSVGDEIAAREELENLQRVFSVLVKKEVGKITKEKIFATMKRLKFPNVTMGLVEDLIWEVDEDCDGMLSWDEFKGMFFCVRNDKTGWEPRRLFNLVEVCAALRALSDCRTRACRRACERPRAAASSLPSHEHATEAKTALRSFRE